MVRRQVEGFKEEQILARKSASEIVPEVEKQLERFQQLRNLIPKIGGDAESVRIIDEQAFNLQARAQNRINQLEANARKERLEAIEAEVKARVEAASKATAEERKQLAILRDRLSAFGADESSGLSQSNTIGLRYLL